MFVILSLELVLPSCWFLFTKIKIICKVRYDLFLFVLVFFFKFLFVFKTLKNENELIIKPWPTYMHLYLKKFIFYGWTFGTEIELILNIILFCIDRSSQNIKLVDYQKGNHKILISSFFKYQCRFLTLKMI